MTRPLSAVTCASKGRKNTEAQARVQYEREDSGKYKRGTAAPEKVLHDKD